MLNKPNECQGCVLADYKGGFSQPEGSCKNGVLIIGEALGENEREEGLPFRPYAESGSALQTCINNLKKFGINQTREDFSLYNIVNCQPPRNLLLGMPYEEEAVKTCKANYLDKVVAFYKPKVILALGGLPTKWLVPSIKKLQDDLKERIFEAKQKKEKEEVKYLNTQLQKLYISALRGYKFDSIYGIPLVCSFHPSFITRGERVLLGVLLRDLMFALEVAKGEWKDYKFENYVENPSSEKLKAFYDFCKKHPDKIISYDIETPYTTLEVDESTIDFGAQVRDIDSIQFSIHTSDNDKDEIVTTSIFVDWNEENLPIIKDILALNNAKVGWNNLAFDETNLKYHLGEDALKGIRYDGMWAFKHLNADFKKVGRALQFAANFYIPNLPAWKHLSDLEPRKYGLIDVDATLKTFLGIKKQLEETKLDKPKAKTLWQGYVDDIVELYPILQAMTKRGFPINLKERDRFDAELKIKQAQVLEELQDFYPTILRRPDPQLGYKIVPKEVGELTERFEKKFCDLNSPNFKVFLSEKEKELILSRYIERFSRRKQEGLKKDIIGQTGLVVKEFLIDKQKVKRYCRLDRFKPNSPQQIKLYIKFKGYKAKKKRQGREEVETADKNAMYDLYEEYKDDFFLKCGFYKELRNIRGTYIKGWPTDEEGRVHSTFLPLPATGQLSSVRPNIQNSPGHGTRYNSKDYVKLAQQFRKCIQPKSGHTLVGIDYTGFHAIMLGVEAEDDTYVRLAKLGIHDFLTAHMVRNEYSSRRRLVDVSFLKGGKTPTKSELDKLKDETLERTKDLDKWLDLKDDELSERLQWVKLNHKLIRDAQAKPAVHGVGFGMGVAKFFKLNKHAFSSMEEPKRILLLLRKLFPKVFLWQDYIKELAHNQTYLLSRYGYIRRFWDVYDFRLLKEYRTPKSEYEKIFKTEGGKYWLRTDGQQVKESIAFLPANNAFGKKKEAIRDLEDLGLLEKYRWTLDNHDELLFECPDEFVDECAVEVSRIMELPTRHISTSLYPNGISCPTSVKIGRDWSEMKGYKV